MLGIYRYYIYFIDENDRRIFEERKEERKSQEQKKQQFVTNVISVKDWLILQFRSILGPLPEGVSFAERQLKQIGVFELLLIRMIILVTLNRN